MLCTCNIFDKDSKNQLHVSIPQTHKACMLLMHRIVFCCHVSRHTFDDCGSWRSRPASAARHARAITSSFLRSMCALPWPCC